MPSGLTGCNLSFGPSKFVGIDASHLQANFGTVSAVSTAGFYSESGSTSLSAGSVAAAFNNRFPTTPKVFVTNISDANVIRVSAASDTQFTATGTGSTSFYWYATT